jgi:transformer-2 protein
MRDGDKPAENRRSRSPERREAGGEREGERGRQVYSKKYVLRQFSSDAISTLSSDFSINPGNNLHVSGLSHKVDNRELETAFSKYGKVGNVTGYLFGTYVLAVKGRPGCHYV